MNTSAAVSEEPISIAAAATFYLGAVAALALLVTLSFGASWVPIWFLPLMYLVAGCALNRVVLRRLVEFHPLYNTLGVVAKTKLVYVLFWPFAYAYLLVMLLIDRVL
ncbi:hypothetical protein C405_21009 [Stenotrophomonas maltophilia AU12-09]|uniref:hypothetical protein n=1 Tax=Stenotrophomonas maltophilia TaxID=40324 RepID=UPI0002BEAD86|nr:hypothetical protein [Stenotrophomonas maltophilia]EMI47530.1 hypothetical protein C405_21009 [Stenotrophomonas maltophilia AU12-09]